MISSSGTSSKPPSASMPFRYLIGCPLGSWIMRKAIAPSLEMAGNILTGTSTRERRRLPDQTGMGAMGILGNATDFPNLEHPLAGASEQRWTAKRNQPHSGIERPHAAPTSKWNGLL